MIQINIDLEFEVWQPVSIIDIAWIFVMILYVTKDFLTDLNRLI